MHEEGGRPSTKCLSFVNRHVIQETTAFTTSWVPAAANPPVSEVSGPVIAFWPALAMSKRSTRSKGVGKFPNQKSGLPRLFVLYFFCKLPCVDQAFVHVMRGGNHMEQKKEHVIQEKQNPVQQGNIHDQEEDIRQGKEGMDSEGPSPQKKHSHQDPMGKLNLSRGYNPLPQHGRKQRQ